MKTLRLTASPMAMVTLLIISSFIFFGISIWLTEDRRWLDWHLSRLGEGRLLSSYIFNSGLIVAAVILLVFTRVVNQSIQGSTPKTERMFFQRVMNIAYSCLVGVALFPFDEFPVLHNVFGYGFFFAVGFLTIAAYNHLRFLSRRTQLLGWLACAMVGTLMALHHLYSFTTLLTVELVGAFFLLTWLMSVADDTTNSRQRSRLDKKVMMIK